MWEARGFRGILAVGITLASVSASAAVYSGGTGEPNDPYQISGAADLITLGESPEDYDKHFVLTADIDLSGLSFERAVIASDFNEYDLYLVVIGEEVAGGFTGTLDGHGHTISNLSASWGLFGWLGSGGEIRNLGLLDAKISGGGGALAEINSGAIVECFSTGEVTGWQSGGLVGWNLFGSLTDCHSDCTVEGGSSLGGLVGLNVGHITRCYSTGAASSTGTAGGLVGENGWRVPVDDSFTEFKLLSATITGSHSTSRVTGGSRVGGLVGSNDGGVLNCYSTGTAEGDGEDVGGLVGFNGGSIVLCYSTATVNAVGPGVGGLVGSNDDFVINCFSSGSITGNSEVGGLVGHNFGSVSNCYASGTVVGDEDVGGLVGTGRSFGNVAASFWDIDVSAQTTSVGGIGLTAVQAHNVQTYVDVGWDFVDEIENGTSQLWQMPTGGGWPVLARFEGYLPVPLQGQGTLEEPYLISNAEDLGAVVYSDPAAHYRLTADIDLTASHWSTPVVPLFEGVFDGNDFTITGLTIEGADNVGLFGRLTSTASVQNLNLVDVNVTGGASVGALVGENRGSIAGCHSEGLVRGDADVGGLVGLFQEGRIVSCSSTCTVDGRYGNVGGLVGDSNGGTLANCYSNGSVHGGSEVGGLMGVSDTNISGCYFGGTVVADGQSAGGLVGWNAGRIVTSYNHGTVTGVDCVGGLVGSNGEEAPIHASYNSGPVEGQTNVGGIVGELYSGDISQSFWDKETSGQLTSDGGVGLTTSAMQTASTFLAAGWDFIGETENGTQDTWWLLDGQDYPRLWWELTTGN